jgi:hypothetical protein
MESYQCDHTLTETEEEKYIQEKKLLDIEYEFCRSQLEPLWNPESEAHWIENVIKVRDWKRNTSNPNKLDLYFYYKAAKEGFKKYSHAVSTLLFFWFASSLLKYRSSKRVINTHESSPKVYSRFLS